LFELFKIIAIATVIILECSFAIWILLKWALANFKYQKQNVVVENKVTPLNTTIEDKVSKNLGVVEVDVKKQINITEADVSDLKSDEQIKGKVKTQKDKLKKLRG
tara:strand:- start:319 stop:633 length:315 start_codon:yes stop_codon:yes gene_type:complete